MGNSGSAIDYLLGKDSKDKNFDEKLPDGDKYFGLINVIQSLINVSFVLG